MPTILRINGYRFFFYSSDQSEPAHIHVAKGSGIGKIWLIPELKVQYLNYFTRQEERQIIAMVDEHKSLFKEKWNEFFHQ